MPGNRSHTPASKRPPGGLRHHLTSRLAAAAILALVALIPYLQSWNFDFINFDDYQYVVYSKVANGLTPDGVKWAFTDVTTTANWHPLTYLSLMLDVTLFGCRPGPLHLVNAALHAVAAALLFILLLRLLSGAAAGATSRERYIAAACAALLWAWHPLRAESVAWISSRKDVLSACFCLAGLLAHLSSIREWRGNRARTSDWRHLFDSTPLAAASYHTWLAMLCFLLGYMSKPTMMVFPAFIILLEWLQAGAIRWRLLLPYGIGGLIALAITISAQGDGGAITTENSPLFRVANAIGAIGIYLRQTLHPAGLMVFYPYPRALNPSLLANGAATLTALLLLATTCYRRLPEVTLGILWFLIALIPVIGLIQVGSAAHADRYTYISQLGFAIMAAILLLRLQRHSATWRQLTRAALLPLLLLTLTAGWRQVSLWRDDPTMFSHMLAIDPDNELANRNYGLHAYGTARDYDGAIDHLARYFSLVRGQRFAERSLYVLILAEAGRLEEARLEASRLSNDVNTHLKKTEAGTFIAWAAIAYFEGDHELAQQHATSVLQRIPKHPDANYLLGLLAHDRGDLPAAISYWQAAMRGDLPYQFLKPRILEAQRALANGAG